MTALAQTILNTFDQLPDAKQRETALEILRRLVNFDFSPLADEDLVLSAEALWRGFEEAESDGRS